MHKDAAGVLAVALLFVAAVALGGCAEGMSYGSPSTQPAAPAQGGMGGYGSGGGGYAR